MARYVFWKDKLPKRLVMKYEHPKEPGEGERLPDFVHVTGYEHFRLDVPKPCGYVVCVEPPGEHVLDVKTDICERCGKTKRAIVMWWPDVCTPRSWWACDPLGHWLPLTGNGYHVEEEGDRSITVKGMIENRGPYSPYWRGTLELGRWCGEAVADPDREPAPEEPDADAG